MSIHNLLLLALSLMLGLACGGGSSPSQTRSSAPTLRFQAKAGDVLKAYAVSNALTPDSKDLVAESTPNASTGLSEISVSGDQSYRLVLERSGLPFLETIILQEQFGTADGDALDIGEISALSTLMVWAAYIGSENNSKMNAEAILRQQLQVLRAQSSIQVLSEMRADRIKESLFGSSRVHQMNLMVVTMARVADALQNDKIESSAWLEMKSLLQSLFRAVARDELLAVNDQLVERYITLFNDASLGLPVLSPARVDGLWVEMTAFKPDAFLNLCQSSLRVDVEELFLACGLK